MSQCTVGILSGSGLYSPSLLDDLRRISVDTPFGPPSSQAVTGCLGDVRVIFISRHAEGHLFSPSEINYRANIYALKSLGAQWCLSLTVVRSLKEEIAPGQIVIPDQFIDLTKHRVSTFFTEGICAHIAFGSPVCPVLKCTLAQAAQAEAAHRGVFVQDGGVYLCMEGPAWATRAESQMYRSYGADVLGMTAMPEAKLAREAEMAYGMVAVVGDYDSWKTRSKDEDPAKLDEQVRRSAELFPAVAAAAAQALVGKEPSALAAQALSGAIMSDLDRVPGQVRDDLKPIIGRYVPGD